MSNWASPYERATNCTGTVTQGARALLAYCQETYAGSSSMGIYNCRTVRGGESSSVHSEGRALDLDPDGTRGANGYATGRRIVADLGRHGARLGIQFVIYNREAWSAASPHGRYYGGVHPHNDHLHIELTWAAARNLTLATLRSVLGGTTQEDALTPELKKYLQDMEARLKREVSNSIKPTGDEVDRGRNLAQDAKFIREGVRALLHEILPDDDPRKAKLLDQVDRLNA